MKPWTEYGGFKPPSGQAQQGTLFRLSGREAGLAPEHQYPRGYTPERLRAVAGAVPPGSVGVSATATPSHYVMDTHQAWFKPTGLPPTEQDRRLAEHQGQDPDLVVNRRWQRPMEEITATRNEVARKRIVDTVARSGMPTEHMDPMPAVEITGKQKHQMGWGGFYTNPERAAGQEPTLSALPEVAKANEARQAIAAKAGRVNLLTTPGRKPADEESTLLHELGHHVSWQTPTEHSAYLSARQRGQEEAFADDYMRRQHRTRRGQEPPDPHSAYQNRSSWTGLAPTGEEGAAHLAYMSARQTLPEEPKEAPYTQPHPRLFQRPASVEHTNTEKDYGQWGYRTPEGEALGTVGLPPPPREQRMRTDHPFTTADIGEHEDWGHRNLTERTTKFLEGRWGKGTYATKDVGEAVRRWGQEHPHLGWD